MINEFLTLKTVVFVVFTNFVKIWTSIAYIIPKLLNAKTSHSSE